MLLAQLEHQFATSPAFTLQKLWFYLHPTLHTLSLIHGLTAELYGAEEHDGEESVGEQSSDDDGAFGGEGLKAVLGEMNGLGLAGGGIVKGGEVLAILWERMMNMSG